MRPGWTHYAEWFRDKIRGNAELVWTCAGGRLVVTWTKDAEGGTVGPEERRKTTVEVHGCNEGHAGGWCDRGVYHRS